MCAVSNSGTATCWGGEPQNRNITAPADILFDQLAVGSGFACGIRSADKRAQCFGNSEDGADSPPATWFD
jgi:hypothetical protein